MKKLIGLILIVSVLASGCLDLIVPEKVPVLYLHFNLSEGSDGSIIMDEISSRGDEMPKLQVAVGEYPTDFPAFYVDIVQNSKKVSNPAGKFYYGPGNYSFMIGFTPEFNKSEPFVVSASGVDAKGEYNYLKQFMTNWSTDARNKSFK